MVAKEELVVQLVDPHNSPRLTRHLLQTVVAGALEAVGIKLEEAVADRQAEEPSTHQDPMEAMAPTIWEEPVALRQMEEGPGPCPHAVPQMATQGTLQEEEVQAAAELQFQLADQEVVAVVTQVELTPQVS